MFNLGADCNPRIRSDRYNRIPSDESTGEDRNQTSPSGSEKSDQGEIYYQAEFSGHQLQAVLDEHAQSVRQFRAQKDHLATAANTTSPVNVTEITESRDAENDATFQEQKKLLSEADRKRLQTERAAEIAREKLLNAITPCHKAEEKLAIAQKNLDEATTNLKYFLEIAERHPEKPIENLMRATIENESKHRREKVAMEDQLSELQLNLHLLTTQFEQARGEAKRALQSEVDIARNILKITSGTGKELSSYWRKLATQAEKKLAVADKIPDYEKPLKLGIETSSNEPFLPTEKTALMPK